MNAYAGKICPYCKMEIKEDDEVKVCPECGIPHHAACWEENGGCTTSGCGEQYQEEQHQEEQPAPPADVCANCGAPLEEEQAFCPKCGTPKSVLKQNVCGRCGAELQDGQAFCPKCGQKVGFAVDDGAQNTNTKKKKMTLVIAAAAVAAVIIILIAVSGGTGKKDFHELYSDIAGMSWCTIPSDGSYMKIDTNPWDTDSDDLTLVDYESYIMPANEAIERINKELGFSDALLEKMNTTTWSQGRQTDSNDKYTVTWTYHPDKGLEVMYEFKK